MSDPNDQKIDAWLDGEIDAETRDELNAWVKESPENAAQFAERSFLHTRLFDWARARSTSAVDVVTPIASKPGIGWQPIFAAAALLMVLGMLASVLFQPAPGEIVATLVESPAGKLMYRGDDLISAGDADLRTGEFSLESGLAVVAFETGVELVLEAPAVFELVSRERVKLHKGRVVANVPPEGIGFAIETPSAEVIDFGTEFAVEVGADQSSEVHVFQGEVQVQPNAAAEKDPVRLLTNDATRVEFESEVPLGIPVDEQRFLRTLKEPIRYAPVVKEMQPDLYFRMGVPKDGITMRDTVGNSDGRVFTRGGKRPPFAPGKVGASARINGPKDGAFVFVEDYPKTKNALTVSCWVLAESRPRGATIATNNSPTRDGQFRLGLRRDKGDLQVKVVLSGGEKTSAMDSVPFPLGEWQHVAFTADGEKLRLFRNGVEVGSAPCGPIAPAEFSALVLGARCESVRPSARQFWHGRIDEFALFNRALTEAEILTLYERLSK